MQIIITVCCEDGKKPVDRRRSGRIQKTSKHREPKDRVAAQKPSRRKASPPKRERESSMVQLSQSLSVKLMRTDTTDKLLRKSDLDLNVASRYQMSKHKETKGTNKVTPSSSTHIFNVKTAGQSEDDFDFNQSDMEADYDCVKSPERPPSMAQWVIGPLFQSFKSKMASFTEIVMSPVRLFKPNGSPPEPDLDISASHGSPQQGPGYGITSETVKNPFEVGKVGHDSAFRKCLNFSMNFETHSTLTNNLIQPEDKQSDTLGSNSSEKEINNDYLPCKQSRRLLRSSIKDGSDSTESKLNSSFQHPDSSSVSCGPKLVPKVQIEKQKDSTLELQRPMCQQLVCQNTSEIQSCPPATTGASDAESFSSLPAEIVDFKPKAKPLTAKCYEETKVWDSNDSERSSPTSPGTLCQADNSSASVGLPQDQNMLCGHQLGISVRRSPRKPLNVSVNEITLNNHALVSQSLQNECEEKQSHMAGRAKRAKRRCLAAPLTTIKKDRKRVKLMKGERWEEVTRTEDTVDNDLESSTLSPVEHTIDVEPVMPRVGMEPYDEPHSLKRMGLPRVHSTMYIKTTQKPSETHVLLMQVKDKGGGRRESIKNMSQTLEATSTDGSVLEHINRTLCDNSTGPCSIRDVTSALTYDGNDCSSACNLEMETTMTTTLNQEFPVSGQHLDVIGKRPQPRSKSLQKYTTKKRNISPMVEIRSSHSNPKCPKLNETAPEESFPLTSRRSVNWSSSQDRGTSVRLPEGVLHLNSLQPSKDDNVNVDSRSSDMTQPTLHTNAVVDVHKEASWEEEMTGSCKSSNKKGNESSKSSVTKLLVAKRLEKPIVDDKGDRQGSFIEDNNKTSDSQGLDQIKVEDRSWPWKNCPKSFIKVNKNLVKNYLAMQGNVVRDPVEEVLSTASKPPDLSQNHTDDVMEVEKDGNECSQTRLRGRGQKKKAPTLSKKHRPVVKVQQKEERMAEVGERFTKKLLRSYSCPEIPVLVHHDSQPNAFLRGRIISVPRLHPALLPPVPLPPALSRRARRHTVSSGEIERDIAPLCLRKEVFPSRRSDFFGSPSPSTPLSPSTSISARATCFLSSPLAFLSRKLQKGSQAATSSACGHASSTPFSGFSFTSSCSSLRHLFSSSDPSDLLSPDISSASVSSICSALSQIPLEGEGETSKQREEDGENVENSDCFSLEFEAMRMREEKALSDSEIKLESCKHEERRKVSSIRIRKALPKPLHNLTPMGLPKPIRVKKKEFSLEEIYTNKNFTKPPERRLETIFEVPLSRRDGSQAFLGQKRMKRFLEFPEVGVVRKPRKPLVGAGAGGGSSRKAGVGSSFGRPKRGVCPSSKDDSTVNLLELDSLLCAKLDQLDSWLAFDEEIC
ncbi:uncharacterized protein prr14 isoform X2 [Esox lucius]|uniref:Tantalus-like domain-containing protein n=1 Tax=Esox lucius TaxID=8010 RepID=A0AAY5KLG8_ESOLU|nr:uncharacterized protein prr14 isoform X2 [Esox lucius]